MRQMEASLTCAVCLSLFEDPVTFPKCSHNFCRPCVAKCLDLARESAVEATRRRSQGGGGANNAFFPPLVVSVPCPLCRKPCSLASKDGAASLPVNTTLAEVVKLFKGKKEAAAAEKKKKEEEGAWEEGEGWWWAEASGLVAPCEKHPGRQRELYCSVCRRGGCGRCVAEEHRGLLHAVNLVDIVYQEEKLAFFSNMKKIREFHAGLLKEVTSPKDAEVVIQHEEEIIKTEFEKVCHALELRKKQLLEDLENQKKRKEKETLMWKQMKEIHRKSIEYVLNDCEKLLEECDPHRFLEVACSLNQRMKTQLDLMQMSSKHENQSECGQRQLDTTSIVNDILALNLTVLNLDADTADISPRGSVCSISANCGNKWEDKKNRKDGFCPVAGEDIVNGRRILTRHMSICATAEFESMSHEELRYNYYMKQQVRPGELQKQTLNENNTFPKSLLFKNTSFLPFSLRAEAKFQKKPKMHLLQRQRIKGSNLSDSVGFTFRTEAVNFNFSGSNNNTHQLNVTEPQNDSKEISLLKNTNGCFNAAKIPLLPAVTVPSETPVSLTVFPKVPTSAVTSASTLNLHSLTGAAKQPTAPLVSCSSGNLTVPATKGSVFSFKKESTVSSTLFFGKPVTQDGNTNNLTAPATKGSVLSFKKESTVSSTLFFGKAITQDGNTNNINGFNSSDSGATTIVTITGPKLNIPANENSSFSPFSTNAESNCFQKTKPGSSGQTSFSFIPPVDKIMEGNKACFSMEKNTGHNSFASSAVNSAKDLVCNSSITSHLASKMSSSPFDHTGASKKQAVPNRLSSNNNPCTYISPCVFSFIGGMKNDCDTLKPFCKIECTNDKSKTQPKEKYSAVSSVPSVKAVYQELKHLIHCSSSSSIDSTPKSENTNTLVTQENGICEPAFSNLASAKLAEKSNTFENRVTAVEDQRSSVPEGASCTVNSDSDTEDLSQASSASDSSSTTEWFSSAEDKTSS